MASNNPGSSNGIAGALTFPASNDNLQPVPQQPRYPQTLQSLLRFAMEATKAEDAPGESALGPMDEERRSFLENALNYHTVRIDEILKRNIQILTNSEKINSIQAGQPLPEDVLIAFQELGEYIDDIDVANDFEKMGGFAIFPLCYSTENTDLHRWANLTLAQVCQNNPRCQQKAINCCLLQVLMQRLRERGEQLEDRSLRALSSMIRNNVHGTTLFVAHRGCDLLTRTLRLADHSEFASAAFLVTYLCKNNKQARDKFIKSDIIQIVVEALKNNRTNASEYLLSILSTLIEIQPDLAAIYQNPALDLRRILADHLKIEDVKNGRFIEEKEYCEKIIRLAFEDDRNGHSEVVDDIPDVEHADR